MIDKKVQVQLSHISTTATVLEDFGEKVMVELEDKGKLTINKSQIIKTM